jgi:hypothetical protein
MSYRSTVVLAVKLQHTPPPIAFLARADSVEQRPEYNLWVWDWIGYRDDLELCCWLNRLPEDDWILFIDGESDPDCEVYGSYWDSDIRFGIIIPEPSDSWRV